MLAAQLAAQGGVGEEGAKAGPGAQRASGGAGRPPSSKAKATAKAKVVKPAAAKGKAKIGKARAEAGGVKLRRAQTGARAALGQYGGEPTAPVPAQAAERAPPALGDEAIFSERAWDFQTAAEAARAKAASVPEEAAAALGAAAASRVTAALEASTPAALALTAEELAEAQAAQAVPTGPVQVPEPVAEVVDQKAVLDYLRREILGPDEEEQPAPDPADPAGGGASSEEEFALVPAAGKAPAEPPAAAAGPSFEDVPGGPGAGSAGEDDWDPKLERIDSGRRSRQRAARAAEPGAAPPAAWKTAQEDSIPSWFREKMAALASSDSESD